MREAWSSTDLNLLRTRPQSSRWFAAVHVPGSLLQGTISAAPAAYPASVLDISSLSGNSALVQKDMTLILGTAPGASDRGMIRIARDMTNSSLITTAEYGSGLILPYVGTYVTVLDQFLPWTIHSKYDTAASDWYVDGESLASQLYTYGPQVNMGTVFVDFLEDGSLSVNDERVITGRFVGNRTEYFGAAGSSYLWTFPNGSTVTTLGTPTVPVEVNFGSPIQTGQYFSLKVTDANGASSIGRRLMFLFNDRTEPMRVEFGEVVGGLQQGGYEVEIRATANAGFDKIPELAEVVIFEEASYGNTGSMIGGNFPFRSNVVFRGWVVGETVRINPFDSDVLFRAVTLDGILRETESYDAFLADTRYAGVSASNSVPASSLNIDRVAYYLINKRSTVGAIADFRPAGGMASANDVVIFQDLPRSTFWEQLYQNYHTKGILGYIASDMQGNLYAGADAQITGGSAGLPLGMDITKADRRDQIIVNRTPIDVNSEVQLYSVSSATPFGAQSPGDVAGYFGRKTEHARGLFVDQQTLTTWAGNYRAKLNAKIKSAIVPLAGNMRYDPVPQSRVRMSLSAIDNARGMTWVNKEFLAKQLRITYNSLFGAAVTELDTEEVVNGRGGSAVTFPRITVLPGDPGSGYPPPEFEDPPDPPTFGSGLGTVYTMNSTTVARTSDFSASSPAWTNIHNGLTGTFHDMILDPWNPTRGIASTSDGLFLCEDMKAASPSWSSILTAAQAGLGLDGTATNAGGFRNVTASINYRGFIATGIDTSAGEYRVGVAYSSDYGDTWSYITIRSFGTLVNSVNPGKIEMVPHSVAGHVVMYYYFGTEEGNSNYRHFVYKTANSGASWTLVRTFNFDFWGFGSRGGIHCPYTGNQAGNLVWISYDNSKPGAPSKTYYSTDSLATLLDKGDVFSSAFRGGLETHTYDNERVIRWTSLTPYLSTDQGTNWTTKTDPGGVVRGAGGFPYNDQLYYACTTNGIFVTLDGCDTWLDKTGTGGLASAFVIVPDWTE